MRVGDDAGKMGSISDDDHDEWRAHSWGYGGSWRGGPSKLEIVSQLSK